MTRVRRRRLTRSTLTATVAGFVAAVAAAPVQAIGIKSQWVGAPTFGISFNNPMSAWANNYMWQSTTASISMRAPLQKLGYSDAQLDHMSADEMIRALRGGSISSGSAAGSSSSSGVVAPAAPPVVPEPVAPIVYNPQLASAKTQIGKGDLAGLVFPVTTATKFVPSKKRLVTKQLAQALTKVPAEQKAILDLIEAGLRTYDQEAEADGLRNDVAGSMAFMVGTCDYVINDGVEPDPEGLTLVAKMLQQSLESPPVKKISSADKQRMHEYLVGFASVVIGVYQVSADAKDTATINALKQGCDSFAQTMLHADFSTFKITGFGLEKEG